MLFRKYTVVEGALKNQIVTALEPVFLSPLVDQLTGFFTGVRANHDAAYICQLQAIDEIDLEENSVKMMGPYGPAEPLARLIQQLEKGREFARAGGQTISDAMMMSKGITLLAQTRLFNDDIRDWRRQSTDLKTWAKYIYISH